MTRLPTLRCKLERLCALMLIVQIFLFVPVSLASATQPALALNDPLRQKIGLQGKTISQANAPPDRANRPLKASAKRYSVPAPAASNDPFHAIRSEMLVAGALKRRITQEQRDNLLRLSADAPDDQAVQVVFDKNNGTPLLLKTRRFLRGDKQLATAALSRNESMALQFLDANKQLLKLKDPHTDLVLKKSWSDHQGANHYKYQQMVGNIPVFGKQLMVHVDSSNTVYLLNGRFEPTPQDLQAIPEITPTQALESVKLDLNIFDLSADSVELVFFTHTNGAMVLTYKLRVAPTLAEAWVYFVNTTDAKIVHRMTDIRNEVVRSGGFDLNAIYQMFNSWYQDNTYYLVDPTLPSTDIPVDPLYSIKSPGNTYIFSANHGTSILYHLNSSLRDSGWDAAGVSAMAHINATHAYYKNMLDRNGLDDSNKNYMAVVHYGYNYANAFWNGKYIVFGDGDGRTLSNLAGALDIAAHELQHGITQFTADLVYENQSGALNEAYSDLFAAMVDDDDWTIGEECTLAYPGYLRNLGDPALGLKALPTTMSAYKNLPNTQAGDWGGVHTNMSIASHAGYLMAEGLRVKGIGTSIGREKTARIWYRALTTYLTAYSQFNDARMATIQSAEDLYGAGTTEVAAVQAAWDAVEVYGNEGPSPTPESGETVAGDDLMLYLYPIDQTHDKPYDPSEHYHLYALVDATGGDVQANDKGPLNDTIDVANLPRYTKPAAYTTANGDTLVLYATEDFDLHRVWLYSDGSFGKSEEMLDTKDIFSIALSPDGRYLAYTRPDDGDNHIYVHDFVENRSGAVSIHAEGDDTFDKRIYADSMAFDFTGKTLVFDAFNCVSTSDSLCTDGNGYRYWSIGLMTLADDPDDKTAIMGTLSSPFPSQDPNYDVSYPAFAANNSYVLAVDITDYSNYPEINAMVWTINGTDGQSRQLTTPNLDNDKERVVYGVPTFWGDDEAITIQGFSSTNARAYRVPVDHLWAGPADPKYQDSDSITVMNDYAVAMPLMHHQAARSVAGEITFSTLNLVFSGTTVGAEVTQDITISNDSDRDIRIQDIALSGSEAFAHDGINGLLARGTQMIITVSYLPAAAGAQSAILSITSDADEPTSTISITGSTATSTPSIGSGGGGGGGCMISSLNPTPAGYGTIPGAVTVWIVAMGCMLIGFCRRATKG